MEQNYSNHRRYPRGYYAVLAPMILFFFVWSVVHLVRMMCCCHGGNCSPGGSCGFGGGCCLFRGLMPLLVALILIMLWWYSRAFAIKVQDRAIRAEENMRHFILTGKPLDSRLTMGQIVALRFAGDDEFLPLIERAINEQMKPDDIKKAIKNWRADNSRC